MPLVSWLETQTRCSGSANGSGRSSSALITLKTVELAPMPSPAMRMMNRLKRPSRRRARSVTRTSWKRVSMPIFALDEGWVSKVARLPPPLERLGRKNVALPRHLVCLLYDRPGAPSLFIVELIYKVELRKIDAHMAEHVGF